MRASLSCQQCSEFLRAQEVRLTPRFGQVKSPPVLSIRRSILPTVCLLICGTALAAWFHLRATYSENPQAMAMLRQRTPPGMTFVPGGPFIAGSDDPDADDDSRPSRTETISGFYIDLHEVTNSQFHKFDPTYVVPTGEADLPANSITYDRAAAFAHWAGKRLPTDAEWEKTARGVDGRRYPWGNVWDPKRVAQRGRRAGYPAKQLAAPSVPGKSCAVGPSRLQAVGRRLSGASPYGCQDMAGNAWEWVQGFYNGNPQQRILRGGAVGYGERAFRTYVRAIEGAADT